jgi:uncharacterized NAD(P)/FAD-binding protein YdhS
MAPEVYPRIHDELGSGRLHVIATRRIGAAVVDRRLELEFETRDGPRARTSRARPATVIDCTGPELDCARSGQTLLRGLVQDGVCTPHPTGLGLAAGPDYQVAEGVYALGALLSGQLWETVAVPELRDQAAAIAAQITASSLHGSERWPRRKRAAGDEHSGSVSGHDVSPHAHATRRSS